MNYRNLHQIKRLGLRYQSQAAKSNFMAEREHVKQHANDAARTWRNITMFVCIPSLMAAGFNAYKLYTHHTAHMQEHPREWVGYDYLNFRAKNFFWGPNSLFFNPKVNHDVTSDD
ncbi:Cytochrome c oxidase subunit 6A, mitochondrial [Choanephora cucurbitarum]|uniref:Cytochrome c oxidase subunit 6A, mitochondrial n=1 Tax=Choanephora cucurbitarum TaxID=101091 RepID=A0A1C7N326_9FUNG|nr:Cytochrome c oxidase subunit 6A, mitochondrial [Choanephora cucurbitarum]